MYLRLTDGAIGKTDRRETLTLPPPARSIDLAKTLNLADLTADGDRLLIPYPPQDDEVGHKLLRNFQCVSGNITLFSAAS
jgi:hypothetical protein